MNQLPPTLERLRKELQFPEDQIEIAIRANFCCEYCGKYLLESVDIYDSWQLDHIVPNGNDASENIALACKTCNFAKRNSGEGELEKCNTRSEKIELAKNIILERRSRKEANLNKVRSFAKQLINIYKKDV